MSSSKDSPAIAPEVIRSPALYHGEIPVPERKRMKLKYLRSGRKFKDILLPGAYWVITRAPLAMALVPMHLMIGLARVLYWLPGNPLRRSCDDICKIAAKSGFNHQPRTVYRDLLKNLLAACRGYMRLARYGVESVTDRVEITPEDSARVNRYLAEHGGAILAAPHNPASAFSAFRLHQEFQTLVIAKNSINTRRTRMTLDVFERMQVKVLMVRGGNPFELSRTMFKVLKKGTLVAATVDNVSRHADGTTATVFGQQVTFAAWAAKIAVRAGVPVVPSYFRSIGERVRIEFGEPLTTDNVEEAVQHYMSYFERKILADPASWVYLGDRRWRKVLRKAV